MTPSRDPRPAPASSLIRRILDLALLRAGPQDLPYSPVLTRNLVGLCLLLGVLYAGLLDVAEAPSRLALSLGLLLALPWVLLQWRGRGERYPQTLAALAGIDALFTAAFLPIAWVAKQNLPIEPGADLDPGQAAMGWLVLALFGWKLMINGSIFKHALELPHALGVLLALSWFAIEFGLDYWLIGAGA